MTKITITRALTTHKVLKKELAEYFQVPRVLIVALQGKSNNVVGHNSESKEKINSTMQADYDGFNGRLERMHKLKAAIIQSNSTTMVTIGGKTYSVAEAIELKATVPFKEALLTQMRKQYTQINKMVADHNVQLDEQTRQQTADIKKASTPDDAETTEKFIKTLEELNNDKSLASVNDYLGLTTKIAALSDEINTIKLELDYVLSESNTATVIEVDLG